MAVAPATGVAGTASDGGARNDAVGVSSVGTSSRAEVGVIVAGLGIVRSVSGTQVHLFLWFWQA